LTVTFAAGAVFTSSYFMISSKLAAFTRGTSSFYSKGLGIATGFFSSSSMSKAEITFLISVVLPPRAPPREPLSAPPLRAEVAPRLGIYSSLALWLPLTSSSTFLVSTLSVFDPDYSAFFMASETSTDPFFKSSFF